MNNLSTSANPVPENQTMAHDPKILERLRKPLEVSGDYAWIKRTLSSAKNFFF